MGASGADADAPGAEGEAFAAGACGLGLKFMWNIINEPSPDPHPQQPPDPDFHIFLVWEFARSLTTMRSGPNPLAPKVLMKAVS